MNKPALYNKKSMKHDLQPVSYEGLEEMACLLMATKTKDASWLTKEVGEHEPLTKMAEEGRIVREPNLSALMWNRDVAKAEQVHADNFNELMWIDIDIFNKYKTQMNELRNKSFPKK